MKRTQWNKGQEETESLLGIARRSLDEVRQVVETLPSYTPVFDMVNELKRAKIETTLDWNPPVTASPRLQADWDLILREGITNILRHATPAPFVFNSGAMITAGHWSLKIMGKGSVKPMGTDFKE